MAALTSCENTLYLRRTSVLQFLAFSQTSLGFHNVFGRRDWVTTQKNVSVGQEDHLVLLLMSWSAIYSSNYYIAMSPRVG